jgi:acetate kinase
MSQQDSNQQPDDHTSSSDEGKEIKIEFAPGAFDAFEGTQEELQELIAEIHRLVATGEIFTKARPLTEEELQALEEQEQHGRQ